MTKEKSIAYKKAYVELNEIIGNLEEKQKEKIPNEFINNLKNDMDKNYSFQLDKSKNLSEQDLMIETQSLLVGIYEKYLASTNEKNLWEKYDIYCLNKIEEKKSQKYNQENLFKTYKLELHNDSQLVEKEIEEISLVEYKKSIFTKILDKIKSLFSK